VLDTRAVKRIADLVTDVAAQGLASIFAGAMF